MPVEAESRLRRNDRTLIAQPRPGAEFPFGRGRAIRGWLEFWTFGVLAFALASVGANFAPATLAYRH